LPSAKTMAIVGIAIIILSSILVYLTYSEAYSMKLEQKYMYTGVYGDIPVKLYPYRNQVYVLSSTQSDDVAVYKLSSDGRLFWRITQGQGRLIPLDIYYLYGHILTVATTKDRHNVIIDSFSPVNGALLNNVTINYSSIYWVFSDDLVSRYVVIGGARYSAGFKLQNFISLTDVLSNKNEWAKIWGGKEVDSIIMLGHNELGIVYLSLNGKDVYIGIIGYDGKIYWNRTLGKIRIVSLKVIGNNAYILAYNPSPLIYNVDLRTRNIITTYLNYLTTKYAGLNITSFDIDSNGTIVIGGYYGETPSKGIVFLSDLTQLEKGHVLTEITITSSGPVTITAVKVVGDTIYVSGTASGTLFVASYGYVRMREWYMVILPILSLISGIALVTVGLIGYRRATSRE